MNSQLILPPSALCVIEIFQRVMRNMNAPAHSFPDLVIQRDEQTHDITTQDKLVIESGNDVHPEKVDSL